MRVKVIKTGNMFQVERHYLVALLVDAGIVELVNEPSSPKPPCSPSWHVGASMTSGEPCIEMRCSCGARNTWFSVKGPLTDHNSTTPDEILRLYLKRMQSYSLA